MGKKILIVTTVPATLYHLLSNQIPFFVKSGYSISLATSSGKGWITAHSVSEKYGLPVYTIPFTRTFALLHDLVPFVKLLFLLKKIDPDIIHYSTPKASLLSALAAFLCRIPLRVYTIRGTVYYNAHGFAHWALTMAEKVTCSLSHKVLAVSDSNKRIILSAALCAPEKILILGNGTSQGVDALVRFAPQALDPDKIKLLRNTFSLPQNAFVFGFIGRISVEKGIIELLTAWNDVKKKVPSTILLVVGNLDESRQLIDQWVIDLLKNDTQIRITEYVSEPEYYYALMNVLVLPSYREGFPNVVLEAAAMEIPALTTDAPGCIDSVINGQTGFVVPAKNSRALAEKMVYLSQNQVHTETMGKQARTFVISHFNPIRISRELEHLYATHEFPSAALHQSFSGEYVINHNPMPLKICLCVTVPESIYFLLDNDIPFLTAHGCHITLITSDDSSWIRASDVEAKYGISVKIVSFTRNITPFKDVLAIFQVIRILQKAKPDIIHANTPKAGMVSLIAAWICRVPFRVFSVWGIVYCNMKGMPFFVLSNLERLTCLLSHKVLTVSNSNKAYLERHRICRSPKLHMIGHGSNKGVDATSFFNPDNVDRSLVLKLKENLGLVTGHVVFGFVGRIVKDKGIDELIEAWKSNQQFVQNSHLLIMGHSENLSSLIVQHNIEDHVANKKIIFTGRTDIATLYYSLMDIFILPSHREGFPNVVLEAGAMQLPTITTDALGCVDSVIDGETGMIYPMGNSSALAQKMFALFIDPNLRKTMGKKSREHVLKFFNPADISEEFWHLYTYHEFKKHDS